MFRNLKTCLPCQIEWSGLKNLSNLFTDEGTSKMEKLVWRSLKSSGFYVWSVVCSVAQLCTTLCAHRAPLSKGFPRQEYWSGLHFLLQGILQTQGSNPHPLCLLHWQVDSLPLHHLGSPVVFHQFSSVLSPSHVWLFVTPWTAVCQASLSITNSWSLLKLMSIESVMPSNHLILSHTLLLPPSIIPRIKIFSNESVLRIRWPRERQLRYPRKGNKIARLDTKLVMNHRAINSKHD